MVHSGSRQQIISVILATLCLLSESLPSCDVSSSPKVSLEESTSSFAISNGFVCVIGTPGAISYAAADHTGNGNYGNNVFTNNGFTLERENTDGSVITSADLSATDVTTSIIDANENYVSVSMIGIHDSNTNDEGTISEDWYLKLNKNARSFSFQRQGSYINNNNIDLRTIRRMWSLKPTSLYAWYEDIETLDQSIIQMKNANDGSNFFPSEYHLLRFYSLGGSGDEQGQVGDVSIDITFDPSFQQQQQHNTMIDKSSYIDGKSASSSSNELNVLLSSQSGDPYWSGLQEIIYGGNTNENSWYDNWGNGWENTESSTLFSNNTNVWNSNITVFINDLDYPAGAISTYLSGTSSGSDSDNLVDDDLHAFLMGIYASPAGALCTHKNSVGDGVAVGQIATTIARPDYGYSGTYNYFDPDNYISTSALLWSGDSFLQEQVRLVLERSGSYLTSDGQLPHHFEGLSPTYQALSGEIQTGPNTFWILSCFNYAKSSGNFKWLANYMPTLRLASNFLYDNIDDEIKLANVPGSLMIDVFLRSNFTSDTNAMLVGFFREFAQAEAFVGNATGSAALLDLADSMSDAMNQYLWCQNTSGYCDSFLYPQTNDVGDDNQNNNGDHFVTQWDGEETPTPYHDFMDYDANLMACAHGIPNDNYNNNDDTNNDDGGARANRIMARIDAGQCRPSATFVSERYYGPDDTTDGNTGDSWCAMGRIAWFDALSRKRYGDSDSFTNKILLPLQSQLLSTTWMHERVACDGSQQLNRTAMYFEYPSMVSMLLYRIKYGIELNIGINGSTNLNFKPFTTDTFSYHVNNMDIEYSPNYFNLHLQRMDSSSSSSSSVSSPSSVDTENSKPIQYVTNGNINLENVCFLHLSPVTPDSSFIVTSSLTAYGDGNQTITSNSDGELDFTSPIVNGQIEVTVSLV